MTHIRKRYRATAASSLEYEAIVQAIKERPDAVSEKVAALANVLSDLAADVEVDPERELFEKSARDIFDQLADESKTFLTNSELVLRALQDAGASEWSPAVIGHCKAVELEGVQRLIEPLRREVQATSLEADLRDGRFKSIARYCVGEGAPPEIGTMAFFLELVSKGGKSTRDSGLVQGFRAIVGRWKAGSWLLDSEGANASFRRLADKYRNPAAHTDLVSLEDCTSCRELVTGPGGVLPQLVAATS